MFGVFCDVCIYVTLGVTGHVYKNTNNRQYRIRNRIIIVNTAYDSCATSYAVLASFFNDSTHASVTRLVYIKHSSEPRTIWRAHRMRYWRLLYDFVCGIDDCHAIRRTNRTRFWDDCCTIGSTHHMRSWRLLYDLTHTTAYDVTQTCPPPVR